MFISSNSAWLLFYRYLVHPVSGAGVQRRQGQRRHLRQGGRQRQSPARTIQGRL